MPPVGGPTVFSFIGVMGGLFLSRALRMVNSSLIACNLFTRDYLLEGITRSQQWLTFADADVIRST